MPYHYQLDVEREFVSARVTGELSLDVIREGNVLVRAEPEFDKVKFLLLDLREITTVTLTGEEMRTLVRETPFGKGTRRAVVASGDHIFGLIRMFHAYDESYQRDFNVFRRVEDAIAWLGIDP